MHILTFSIRAFIWSLIVIPALAWAQEYPQKHIFKLQKGEFLEIEYRGDAAGEIYESLKKSGAAVERIGPCDSRVEDFLVQCERHGFPNHNNRCIKQFDRCRIFAGQGESAQELEVSIYER